MAFRGLLSKPHLTGKFAPYGLTSFWGRQLPSLSSLALANTDFTIQHPVHFTAHHPVLLQHQHQQVRNKWTKTKLRQREKMLTREKRVARGLPAKPLPPKYIPKDRPVINALSREERDTESRKFDEAASEELKYKIAKQAEKEENNNLRHLFDGLQMSERVRRLFDLKNGSQKEVVNSQKRRGMEVRERERERVVFSILPLVYFMAPHAFIN